MPSHVAAGLHKAVLERHVKTVGCLEGATITFAELECGPTVALGLLLAAATGTFKTAVCVGVDVVGAIVASGMPAKAVAAAVADIVRVRGEDIQGLHKAMELQSRSQGKALSQCCAGILRRNSALQG